MAKYLEKMYSGQEQAAEKAIEKAEEKAVKESLWKRGKGVAKDFWEGKNGFGSKVGNRAVAIGVPTVAATAGAVYALRKKAAAANAAADELEAATEQNFSERIYSDAFEAGYMYAQREFAEEANEEEADEESKYGKYKPLASIGAGAGIGGLGGYGSYKLSKKAADRLEKAEKIKKPLQELYEADLDRLKKDVLNDAQRGGEVAKRRALESGKGILDLEKSGMLTKAEKERLNYLRNTVHKRLKTVEGLEKKARNWKRVAGAGIGGLGIVGAAGITKGLYDYRNRNRE